MDKIYYLAEEPPKVNHAGNKARLDVDYVLKRKDYVPYITMLQHKNHCFMDKIRCLISVDYIRRIIKLLRLKNKKLIVQYPIYTDRVQKLVIKRTIRKNKSILIVHDVDSLRNFGKVSHQSEKDVLNSAKGLIVHNESMKHSLRDIGVKTNMTTLGCFDYILDNLVQKKSMISKTIVFAGNLNKSLFLKKDIWKKSMNVHVNLYGPNYQEDDYIKDDFSYKGCFSPNEIPYKLDGSFGLIWDGESIERCSGSFGEYLKYNNPHKTSLYIAAGLPIIVWKEAAVAKFVEEKQIGFSVSNIKEIAERISGTSDDEYNDWINNIKKIQCKLIKGEYTEEAIDGCIMCFNK